VKDIPDNVLKLIDIMEPQHITSCFSRWKC